MFDFIKNFRKDEDGAVTVDFVVVTAAVVGLGIAVLATLADGVIDTASSLNADIETQAGSAQTYTAQSD
jgi:Flp pilus assembly pilin Flp